MSSPKAPRSTPALHWGVITTVSERLTLIAWSAVGLIALVALRNVTVDDAFIGWRHGRNLAEHGVYSFSPGGPRIEAATSTTYGLLGAVPGLIGIDTVFFFKLVALGVVVTFLFLAKRVSRTDSTGGWLVALLALAGPAQAVHIWSGLETGLFVLLATVICLASVGRLKISLSALGLVCCLALLTRQESLLFIVGAVAVHPIKPPTEEITSRRRVGPRVWHRLNLTRDVWLGPMVLLLVLTVFRFIYFGSLVPNTFATKTGSQSVGSMITWSLHNLGLFIPVVLVTIGAIQLVTGEAKRRIIGLAVIAFSGAAIAYLPSVLAMNYAQRFQFQIAWPLVIAALVVSGAPALKRIVTGVVASVILFVAIPFPYSAYRDLVADLPRMDASVGEVARVLADSTIPDGVVVMGDAGLLPFVSGWELLDTRFLGTPSNVGSSGIASQIVGTKSMVLLLYARSGDRDGLRSEEAVYEAAAVRERFIFLGGLQAQGNYWYHLWVSPDLARRGEVVDRLAQAIENATDINESDRVGDSVRGWFWTVG